ncbi:MAG: hypothetical protein H6739_06060 [Alphaproteobacteria bacterium]|nr:hypothetical protein [Alphaproteobacteria bacterium]
MSQHITDDLLRRFVEGYLDEPVAVAVAEHLDGCPLCCTRAAAAEPLSQAFAAVDDPVCPPDLVDDILAALEAPTPERPLPRAELLAASALLSAAALLLFGLGDPAGLLAELALGMSATATALGVVFERMNAAAPWILVVAAAGVCAACAWLASQLEGTTPHGRRTLA